MTGRSKNYALTEDKIITESELRVLLKEIKPHFEKALRDKKNMHHITDYHLIRLASLTGMRISEIASLKLADLHANSISVIGKGNKKRNIPLGKKSKSLLQDFIKIKSEVLNQKADPEDFLFLSKRRQPHNRFSINKMFKGWIRKAGLNPKLTFHSLRHGFATYLLNKGFNLAEIKIILGHSSIQTCSIYLHFCDSTQDRIDAIL